VLTGQIGTVEDVRFGDATGGLKWLVVKTGLLGTKKILVPAGQVRATEEALVVPYPKYHVKDSPGLEESEVLTVEEERKIWLTRPEHVSEFGRRKRGCVIPDRRAHPAARRLSATG
jgi:hypothetical protein